MIALVRRFVGEFYGSLHNELVSAVTPSSWVGSISLAANELVENAVRHGLHGDAEFTLTVDPDPVLPDRAHFVRLTTRNRAGPTQRKHATERILALSRAPDLLELYLQLLTDSAHPGEGPGLGLARVRVEAQMDLEAAIDGDFLVVTARAHVYIGNGS